MFVCLCTIYKLWESSLNCGSQYMQLYVTMVSTIPCMPGNALGSIIAECIYWSGNQFQGHSHHTLLPPKHPLTINDIRPPNALTLKAIIITPLTLGYTYEKLKEEGGFFGMEKVEKGRENRVR